MLPLTLSMMAFQSPCGSRCPQMGRGSYSLQTSFPDQKSQKWCELQNRNWKFAIKSLVIAIFALQSCWRSLPQSISWPISRIMSAFRKARSSCRVYLVYFFKVLPFPVISTSVESEATTYIVGATSTAGLDVPGTYSVGSFKSQSDSCSSSDEWRSSLAHGTSSHAGNQLTSTGQYSTALIQRRALSPRSCCLMRRSLTKQGL